MLVGAKLPQCVAHADDHAIPRQRLLEEVEGTQPRGFDRILDRCVTADHDHRDLERPALRTREGLEHLETRDPRHHHVHDHDFDGRLRGLDLLECLLARCGFEHLGALAFEHHAQGPADVFLVVDDEDAPVKAGVCRGVAHSRRDDTPADRAGQWSCPQGPCGRSRSSPDGPTSAS